MHEQVEVVLGVVEEPDRETPEVGGQRRDAPSSPAGRSPCGFMTVIVGHGRSSLGASGLRSLRARATGSP